MKKPLVLGKYLLLERVNIGGMAEVFIAKTFGVGGFEQILAVKKILPTMAEDEEFIKMFIDEARVSVQLNHPNIVHIHDLDGRDDSYYIVMEYVSGRDLRSVMERFRRRKEKMPIPMAAHIASKMCEGLDHAHRKKDVKGMELNIVHRDVSPQNILLSYEGEVKIIDFGIARTNIRSTRTEAGVIKGKFGYMSPEQAYGLPVDRRSDIFAAAVILYEMLTGEKLFVAESDYSTLEKVRKVEFRSPRQVNADIPPALETVLLRALARDVENRFQWASDFHEELEKFTFVDDGKFSSRHLSSRLKEMFGDEYTREINKLKHYGQLAAPHALLPEEMVSLQDTGSRRGNGQSRTPSGPRKAFLPPAFTPESEATQVVSSEFWEAQQGTSLAPLSPAQENSGLGVGGYQTSAENLLSIQLLSGAPVYTGETVVGKEAASILSETIERPLGLDTARQTAAISVTSEFSTTDEQKESLPAGEATSLGPKLPADASRFRAWLYLGLVVGGLLSLWLVLLVFWSAPSPLGGRLVAVSNPADIPLEIVLKSNSTQREQRFVAKNEAIVLPADTYQVAVNSLDKNYRVRQESAGPLPVAILSGEDFFISVHLETETGEVKPGNGTQGVAVVNPPNGQTATHAGTPEPGKGVEASPGHSETATTANVKEQNTAEKLVGEGTTQTEVLPAKETFVLSLSGLLDGTQVLVGGKSQGTTPALKELVLPMQGPHKIELRRAGFERVTQTIQNTAREKTMGLNVIMRPVSTTQTTTNTATTATTSTTPSSSSTLTSTSSPAAPRGKLVISTEPNGAEIWVNGKKTPHRTPMNFSNPLLLPKGKHTLVFKAGGKQSKPLTVEVTAENASSPLSLRGVRLE